jgi:hypothetical protein
VDIVDFQHKVIQVTVAVSLSFNDLDAVIDPLQKSRCEDDDSLASQNTDTIPSGILLFLLFVKLVSTEELMRCPLLSSTQVSICTMNPYGSSQNGIAVVPMTFMESYGFSAGLIKINPANP